MFILFIGPTDPLNAPSRADAVGQSRGAQGVARLSSPC